MDRFNDKVIELLDKAQKKLDTWNENPYKRDRTIGAVVGLIGLASRIRLSRKRKNGTLTEKQERQLRYLQFTFPIIANMQAILLELKYMNGNLK